MKTFSFAGDGEYKLNGNELTLISSGTKNARTSKIRIFSQKEFLDWHEMLGMLGVSIVDSSFYEVTLIRQLK